ncbi:hypothetical protein [Streptomyces sp. NPDC004266]|uniref:hypothetical protein n=1 Tax=Streptomyces sp. NPDC004266 TaxID=3364693 RepID=UPI0036CF6A44
MKKTTLRTRVLTGTVAAGALAAGLFGTVSANAAAPTSVLAGRLADPEGHPRRPLPRRLAALLGTAVRRAGPGRSPGSREALSRQGCSAGSCGPVHATGEW